MKTSYQTTILAFGNNTGIEVPPANLAELGTSKRPPVQVTIGDYSYKSSVAVMAGKYLIAFTKVCRADTGLEAGDKITVRLELDSGVRFVEIPEGLRAALIKNDFLESFEKLAYSKRKEFARQVSEAKAEDTRGRRIEKVMQSFRESAS